MLNEYKSKNTLADDPNESFKNWLIYLFIIIFISIPSMFLVNQYKNILITTISPLAVKQLNPKIIINEVENLEQKEPLITTKVEKHEYQKAVTMKEVENIEKPKSTAVKSPKITLFPLKQDGGVFNVVLSKDEQTAYFVNSGSFGGVHLFDVTNHNNPIPIVTYNLPKVKKGSYFDLALSKDEKVLYVLTLKHGFFSLDISDKQHPKLLSMYKLRRSDHVRLSPDETKVYVSGAHGVLVFNITNKHSLELLGRIYYASDLDQYQQEEYNEDKAYSTYDRINDIIEVRKDLFYILTKNTIDIVDMSDIKRPKLISKYGTLGSPRKITLSSNKTRAYITGGGIEILDISEPYKPRPLGGYVPSSGSALHATLSTNGTRLYIGTKEGKICVLDVSYPYDPIEMMIIDGIRGNVPHNSVLSPKRNVLYIASGMRSVQVLELE